MLLMKFIRFMVGVPKKGKRTQELETNLSEKN
jgi:hypothetical protein